MLLCLSFPASFFRVPVFALTKTAFGQDSAREIKLELTSRFEKEREGYEATIADQQQTIEDLQVGFTMDVDARDRPGCCCFALVFVLIYV